MAHGGSISVVGQNLFNAWGNPACATTRGLVPVSVINTTAAEAPAPESDAGLLAAATQGDQAAFAGLVSRYQDLVHRVIWRVSKGHADSEDMTQEVFLRLWRNPGQLRDAAALKGWLLRVASNLVMDRFRGKTAQSLEAAENIVDDRPSSEAHMAMGWATGRIDDAIAALPDRQRLALTLVHFEQTGNIRAAEIMGVSVDALESLVARARRSLKQHLAADRELLFASLKDDA